MSDCEKLSSDSKPAKCPQLNERDDFGGMLLNMFGKLDPRALLIVWISFIFLHTELCAENIMKKISGAINRDYTLTMKGTIVASFVMTLIVAICIIVF